MRNKILFIIGMVATGAVIGLFFSGQIRSKASRITNPAYSYNELEALKKNYLSRQADLRANTEKLRSEVKKTQDELAQTNKISTALVTELETQKELAGLLEEKGSGLEVKMSDGAKSRGSDEEKSIAHAADLRDLVNVLWRSGARAVSINGERVVYDTSIDCIVNVILINSSREAAPFTVQALGDSKKIKYEIENSPELLDLRTRASKGLVGFDVSVKDNLDILPYNGDFVVKFAKVLE